MSPTLRESANTSRQTLRVVLHPWHFEMDHKRDKTQLLDSTRVIAWQTAEHATVIKHNKSDR